MFSLSAFFPVAADWLYWFDFALRFFANSLPLFAVSGTSPLSMQRCARNYSLIKMLLEQIYFTAPWPGSDRSAANSQFRASCLLSNCTRRFAAFNELRGVQSGHKDQLFVPYGYILHSASQLQGS